jgi:membrane protease YdiL (CAAX protease family)
MTASTARADGLESSSSETAAATTRPMTTVAWFVGLSLSLALVSILAGAPATVLPFILALGPTGIALLLAWREGHGALGRLRRSLTLRPPRRRWYLVFGFPIVWALATVGVAVLLGAPTAGLFDKAFPAVAIVYLVVLLPAVAEEIAWRGFALPRLMAVMSPVQAALLIGIPWTLIHLGLYLPGQSNAELLLWPVAFSFVSFSVVLTWLFVRTGGSILMTALVHAGLNAISPLMAGVDLNTEWIIRNVLMGVIAVALIGFGGLGRRQTPQPAPAS